MIHANRTFLLRLKKKKNTVASSLSIIRARRQALLQKFIEIAQPFLKRRKEVSSVYAQALSDLYLAMGHDSEPVLASIASVNRQDSEIAIERGNILGVGFREVSANRTFIREVEERNYDIMASSAHLEESINGFERLSEIILKLAGEESRIRHLGQEIKRLSRQVRVLEERILPDIKNQIHSTSQHINEREREEYYRLKRFKK